MHLLIARGERAAVYRHVALAGQIAHGVELGVFAIVQLLTLGFVRTAVDGDHNFRVGSGVVHADGGKAGMDFNTVFQRDVCTVRAVDAIDAGVRRLCRRNNGCLVDGHGGSTSICRNHRTAVKNFVYAFRSVLEGAVVDSDGTLSKDRLRAVFDGQLGLFALDGEDRAVVLFVIDLLGLLIVVYGAIAGHSQIAAALHLNGVSFCFDRPTIQIQRNLRAEHEVGGEFLLVQQGDGRAVRSRRNSLGQRRIIGAGAVRLLHRRENVFRRLNQPADASIGLVIAVRFRGGIAASGAGLRVGAVAVVRVGEGMRGLIDLEVVAAGRGVPMCCIVEYPLAGVVAVAVAVTTGGAAGRLSRFGLGDDVGLVVGDGLAVDGQAGRAVRDHDFRALGSAGDFDVLGDDEHDALAVSLDGRACLVSVGADGAVKDGDGGRAVDVVLRGKLVSRHTAHDTGLNHRSYHALRVGRDLRRVGVLGQVGLADRLNAERATEHDDGTLPGDGRVGRHGAVAVAVEDAGSRAAVDGIIVPGIRRVVGEARVLRGGQLEQLREDGRELRAGELTVGVKLAVAALDDAVATPAFDGALGPMACGVAVGRFDRSCADREQTNCHGEHKNEG